MLKTYNVYGEVWINGFQKPVTLTLTVSQDFLQLCNKGSGAGPNTTIYISPKEISSYFDDNLTPLINSIQLEKEKIGYIEEYSNYASFAADGSYTRMIVKCHLLVERENNNSKFTLYGETNYLEPDSVLKNITSAELKSRGKYEFRIWFLLHDNHFRRLQYYFLHNNTLTGA